MLVGEHAHATIFVALRLLGLGSENAIRVRADDAGRMDPGGAGRGARAGRGAGDRLRPGGRGQHRLLRSLPGPGRDLRAARCMAPRRRRGRALGRVQPGVRLLDRGAGTGRLLVDRRPQMAQRHVRLRLHRGQGRRPSPWRDGDQRAVPDGGSRRPRLLPVRTRVLAARPRLHPVRGTALPGAEGGGRPGRALLRSGPADGRRARAGSGDRGDQRGRHQPGAGRGSSATSQAS